VRRHHELQVWREAINLVENISLDEHVSARGALWFDQPELSDENIQSLEALQSALDSGRI